MEVCLLAGKIMLANGGETYRVEDTMLRIAQSFHIGEAYSYVTPTGIFLTIQGKHQQKTKFIRIHLRSIDLNKVVLVNDISRKISSGMMTIDEAYESLCKIEQLKPLYPIWLQTLAAAISSGFFSLMFGGTWKDFFPALIVGGIGFIIFIFLHYIAKVKFFAEMATAFLIGLLLSVLYKFGFGAHLDKMIIGSIMPLVPGVLITNAVRDLIAGDLVSGLARGAEAFFTALAIGTGVAVILVLFR
ncbi:threonine/serine exporter family protein [Tepidibacillus sp. LV47]|uniref:threonine/serine exporter family protein n=1 Tax=Tepidibacillus sp. LV47 TaxID=3398228 RepID=UPI003AAF9C41